MNGEQKVREILSKVLSIPSDQIDDKVRIGFTKQWDSIAHMNLVLTIEEEVGRKLLPSEYLDIEDHKSLTLFFDARI